MKKLLSTLTLLCMAVTLRGSGALTLRRFAVTTIGCNNNPPALGVVTILANGGTQEYTYSWNGQAEHDPTSPIFRDIPAGTYTFTVTDSAGTQVQAEATLATTGITEDLIIDFGYNCDNNMSRIKINTNGTQQVRYVLLDANNTVVYNEPVAGNVPLIEVAPGLYTLNIRLDEDECGTTSLKVNLPSPPEPLEISSISTTPVTDNQQGSIIVMAQGGLGNYQYFLEPGMVEQATNVFNGLAAGTYTVTVRAGTLLDFDQPTGGCTASARVTIAFDDLLNYIQNSFCMINNNAENEV